MVEFTLKLPDESAEQLRQLSQQSGQTPEELLCESIQKWLGAQSTEFIAAANDVLEKNAELYRRLA